MERTFSSPARHAGGPVAATVAVDPAGRIADWSAEAEALFGYDAAAIVGRHAWALVTADSRALRADLARCLEGESPEPTPAQARRPDGSIHPVLVDPTPLRGRLGRLAGAHATFTPMPADAPVGHESHLRRLIETAGDGFVAMDGAGRITDWNRAAEELFGFPYADVVGCPLGDIIVPERLRDAHRRGFARFAATGEGRLIGRRLALPAQRRDGTELQVELTITPSELDGDRGYSAFLHPVDGLDEAREEAHADESRRRATQRLAGLGSWDWDIAADRVTWSAEQCRMFGVPPEAGEGSIADYIVRIHPDDAVRARSAIEAALDGGDELTIDHRIVRPDGEVRWVRCRGAILRDAAGRAVRMAGTARDVTARVEADTQAQRLAAVVATTDAAVLSASRDGRVTSYNDGAAALYGYPREAILGAPLERIVPAERAAEHSRHLSRVLAGAVVDGVETQHLAADGRPIDVCLTMSPVRDAEGRVVEATVIAHDISDRKRAEAELRRQAADLEALARRDPLTGLLNPREFHGELEREIERARRDGTACAVLLADFHGLAELNQREGREAGDRALKSAAAALRAVCGPEVEPARLGGATLAAVLPRATAPDAGVLGGRMRDALGGVSGLRHSMAVAAFPDAGEDGRAVLDYAEAALARGRVRQAPSRAAVPAELREEADSHTIQSLVALLRRHLRMEVAYLSEFVGEEQVVRVVDAGPVHPPIHAGLVVPLEGSYCRRMTEQELPNVVPDTSAHPVTARLAATREAGLGCYVGVPVRRSDGRLYGSLCCASRSADRRLDPASHHFARVCARLIADLLEHRELSEENRRLQAEFVGVRALLAALDARDHYTGEHSEAVVVLATQIGARLGLEAEELAAVERVALLHDVGKIGIPDSILQKPDVLSEEEWALMREHPAIGERIVASVESIAHLAPAVRAEHERWDGAGYPDRLRGREIPLASRIVLACDAFHAMTSDRPYRAALPLHLALAEMQAGAGTQFDPRVVSALLAAVAAAPATTTP